MTTSRESFYLKPDWRLLVSHPAHFFSLGFGSGLMPKGPGTAGTLVAFPLYWGLAPLMNDYLFLLFLLLAFIIGISICDKTGRALGVPDHGGIVWDEIVAFMLVLFFTPAGIYWQILAFVLFRFFDIVKPQPIKYFDQNMHGGLGVMFDDLLAAGYALLCLAFIKSMMA
ncbi:MAG TPA: phosphatidylglycerophosphatase A [Gallionellaceae bacterium]|jgi:phosphatidylglycerophosphatase A|nr:phosphatidylglycerophosphatase A [Gallionellaceae bacterium]HQS74555.1 phosphatidylglycerophosphatase A [Gallionellaceae bacterium]